MIPSHWKKWKVLEWPPGSGNKAGDCYHHRLIEDFSVIVSKAEMDDGSEWWHVSVSRIDRLPTWEELEKVKREFLGDKTEAFHMVPKKSDYVNVHRYCLHMWSPIKVDMPIPNLKKIKWEQSP